MVSVRRARVILGVLFVVLLSLFFAINSGITAKVISLRSPLIQGDVLEGTYTFYPSLTGDIPLDSSIRLTLNDKTASLPLKNFLSPFYISKNVIENKEYAPVIFVTLDITSDPSYTGTGSGGSYPGGTYGGCAPGSSSCSVSRSETTCYSKNECQQQLNGGDSIEDSQTGITGAFVYYLTGSSTRSVTFPVSKTSPMEIDLTQGERYFLKEVKLHGQPAATNLILFQREGNKLMITTTYTEVADVIPDGADPVEVPFLPFGLFIASRGELLAELIYRDAVITRDRTLFYSFPAGYEGLSEESLRKLQNRQLIPGAPLSKELIEKGCGSYVCESWNECSVAPLDDLIDVEKTLTLVQSRGCHLDCGIDFSQSKPCDLNKRLVTTSSSDTTSSGSGRNLLLFDQQSAQPVARIEIGDSEGHPTLDIILTQSQDALESYCYNGRLDAEKGESDVDCGGFCKKCVENKINARAIILWTMVAICVLFIFLISRRTTS